MRRLLLLSIGCGLGTWLAAGLAATPAAAEDPPGAYVARSPEPTPEETLMLEYINRARANPHGEIARCLAWDRVPDDVDREMFATEMQGFPASPPIFFDLNLLKAARWHSYYMGFNEMEHDEIEGAVGFTAVSAHARMRLAGYSAGGTGENIIKFGRNPWHQHVAFMVDWGEGPGGMQPGRGHRGNIMSSSYRVVGVGAVDHPDGDDFAVTADFGGGNQRYAGGVIYADTDNDDFYDMEEGLGGAPVTNGQISVQSWGSGAYTLPIPNEEGWVKVLIDGSTYGRYFPAGTTNLKIDVDVTDRTQFVSGSAMLEELEDMRENERFKRLIEIGWQLQTAFIRSDANECEQLLEMISEVRQTVISDREQLAWAVQNAQAAAAQDLSEELAARYRGTQLEGWFKDAELVARMRVAYVELVELADAEQMPAASVLTRRLRVLQRQFEQIEGEQWRSYGQRIGDAFVALGQNGDLDLSLLAEADIDAREAFAGGFDEMLGPAPAGGDGATPAGWMTAPLMEAGPPPQDDTEYEESPFRLE